MPLITLKSIVPAKLNISKMTADLIQGMQDLGIEIRENFEDTTKTWHHKPAFVPQSNVPKVSSSQIQVETMTEDEIYGYVSAGTKDHPISAVNFKTLKIPDAFIPKTFPGIVGSGQGYRSSNFTFPVRIEHQSITARKFDTEIKTRQEKNAKIIMNRAMSLARKSSRHAYP